LRIEVTDNGPGCRETGFDRCALGRLGLWLVDRLTDRWGVDLSHSTRVLLKFDRGSA
jgi:hypothetical protein